MSQIHGHAVSPEVGVKHGAPRVWEFGEANDLSGIVKPLGAEWVAADRGRVQITEFSVIPEKGMTVGKEVQEEARSGIRGDA
jgi:hypothetical protein